MLMPPVVSHARQNLKWEPLEGRAEKASFKKDPLRWAATPKFRLILHGELNEKLGDISRKFDQFDPFNFHDLQPGKDYPLGIIAGGVPYAVVSDILAETGRSDIPVLKLGAPYPFPDKLAGTFMDACEKILVIEESNHF